MLFNSFEFLLFFIIVSITYFAFPHKYRWFLLLAASCYFYAAFVPIYILILLLTILIDYFAGIYIEKAKQEHKKRVLLISIIANVSVLAFFKYFNFFIENINALYSVIGYENKLSNLSIILPIGLSFHTFQAMSYTIEVYRGNQKAERHFGLYALYVMFFPQLVAGPIERASHLLPQFYKKQFFNYDKVQSGLSLMLWGFFKKIVIADRLAIVVNEIYNNPNDYHGLTLVVGTVFFAFQIYCDFSGYSDIAIGCARVLGFDLMKNFNYPYFSKSISEFWKRWHISLSTWFRDYVYIPLGGNRTVKWRWYYNLFITFLISGLWHGANWTFIIWGAIHGVFLILEMLTNKNNFPKTNFINGLLMLKTFVFICFGWIFFRANSIEDALSIISSIFDFKNYSLSQLSFSVIPLARNTVFSIDIFLSYVVIVFLILAEYFFSYQFNFEKLHYRYKLFIYVFGILSILLLGAFEKNEFIYFQF